MASSHSNSWLAPSTAVRAALRKKQPVVALESAVLTHGLPAKERLPVARELREVVMQGSAGPAFVALLNGKAVVGLSPSELETLTTEADVFKCARVDLGWLLAQKATAGTTVSATIHIAAQAGIAVVATGGIGGVQRDAAETLDISADLLELSRTPVTLVCSGAKTIVDQRKTLEFLEGQSVPVVGYQTDEMPGFLVRTTGLPLRAAASAVTQLAEAVRQYRSTGYRGTILVVYPISKEAALPADEVESLVSEALRRAGAEGVAGAALTPFLLETMNQLSGGATLRANRALLRANAGLAARLAVALARSEGGFRRRR